MATSRSCLHRRTTSAGRARRGCLPSDGDGSGPGPAHLRREHGAGGSGAWAPKTSKGSSTKASRHSRPKKMELLRRHRRGRRSSSGRAWSEGHRRRGCRPRTGTTKTIRRRLRPPPKVPLPLMTMGHRSLKSRCLRGPAVSAWRKASDRRTSRVDPLRPTTLGLTPWVVVSMSDESWQSRSREVMAGDRRRSRATDGGEGRNIPLVQRSSRTNKSNEASWRTTEMMEMRFFSSDLAARNTRC